MGDGLGCAPLKSPAEGRSLGFPQRTVQRRLTIVERDIYGCALILVHKYGEDAEIEAIKRANEFKQKGDDGGHAVWLRIKKAIQDMQSEVGTRH